MIFYLKLLLFMTALSFVELKLINRKGKTLVFISRGLLPCVLLCFIAGLRSLNVGRDTFSYSRYFLRMTYENVHLFNPNQSWIYNLWDLLIRTFTDNIVVFNMSCSIIIYISIYFFIHKYSCDERVSIILIVTLGIFFNSMNQTRQVLSTAILLWGFRAAVEKNLVKSMALCFIAAFVHNVAIVMIPIYAFICVAPKIEAKVVAIFSCSALGIALFYNRIMELFVTIFPRYRNYLRFSKLFVERRSIYRYADFFLAVIIQIVLVYGLYKSRKNNSKLQKNEDAKEKKNVEQDELGNILACMNAIYLCMTYLILNGDIFNRLKSLFVYWMVLIIPYMIRKYFGDNWVMKVLVCIASIAYMWRLGVHDGDGVVPYSYFFDFGG